ncbi:MAG: hypothetical protein NW206_19670 [Hyphomonadaceae bacterium]|nr:hypothetical protein [Hyphomonadaceae bacterium]
MNRRAFLAALGASAIAPSAPIEPEPPPAWRIMPDGTAIAASGQCVNYSVGDTFSVTYDGKAVRYLHNGSAVA